MMKLSDLQLGDVVQVNKAGGIYPGFGQATVVGLDPIDLTFPVLIGWNGEEMSCVKLGHAFASIRSAHYLPDLTYKFKQSLWVGLKDILSKISSATAPVITERPCRQCKRNNDISATTCWWCTTDNPTQVST